MRGAGLFRTVDGVTWKQLPATADDDFMWLNERLSRHGGRAVRERGRGNILVAHEREADELRRTRRPSFWRPPAIDGGRVYVSYRDSDGPRFAAFPILPSP